MQCCATDCGREATYKEKVLCQKHYFRQWRYGTTELTMRPGALRYENPEGYQWIYDREHPLRHRTSAYVAEHRAVLYAAIGPGPMSCELCGVGLTWDTCKVDHIDTDVRNNARSNLRPTCNKCNSHRGIGAPVTWSRTHKVEFDGVCQTPTEWARDPRVKVTGHTIMLRKKSGMSDFDALFAPKKTHNGNHKHTYRVKARELLSQPA